MGACATCPERAEVTVAGERVGDGPPYRIFVGHSPGRDELAVGRPMIGPFGDLVRQMNEAYNAPYGGRPFAYYLTNLVACGVDVVTPAHVEACSSRLREELAGVFYGPARIVAMGSEAVRFFTGRSRISEVDGAWIDTAEWGPVLCLSISVARDINAFPPFDLGMRKAWQEPVLLHIPDLDYELVDDLDDLRLAPGDVACDIETTVGEDGGRITCLGFCDSTDTISIVTGTALYEQTHALRALFADTRYSFGWHNGGNFDLPTVHRELGFTPPLEWDTILEHYALCETGLGRVSSDPKDNASRGHGLKLLARYYLNVDSNYGKGINFNATMWPDVAQIHKYLAVDVWNTAHLHELFITQLEEA